MDRLASLPNIGAKLESQLEMVGIHTPEELTTIGSKEVWLRILAIDPSACYNRLCALEGAIRKVRWHMLPDDIKAELKAFYRSNKYHLDPKSK